MDNSMAKGLVSRFQRESAAAHKRHQMFWDRHSDRRRPLAARQQRKLLDTSLKNMRPFLTCQDHDNELQTYAYLSYVKEFAGFYEWTWIWDRNLSPRPNVLEHYAHCWVISPHAAQRIMQAHAPKWNDISTALNDATQNYQSVLHNVEAVNTTVFADNADDTWWMFSHEGALLIKKTRSPSFDDWFHTIVTYVPFDKWDDWRHRAWDKWLVDDESIGIATKNGDVVNLMTGKDLSHKDRRNALSVFRTNQQRHEA